MCTSRLLVDLPTRRNDHRIAAVIYELPICVTARPDAQMIALTNPVERRCPRTHPQIEPIISRHQRQTLDGGFDIPSARTNAKAAAHVLRENLKHSTSHLR